MDAQIKQKWVDALRSGNYKQTESILRLENDECEPSTFSYCCLGVLCDVAGAYWNAEGKPFLHRDPLEAEEESLLNLDALYYFGLSEADQVILSDMNDNGKSFDEIAQYIDHAIAADPSDAQSLETREVQS